MIRVDTGRYRDLFRRISYDVFRDRFVEGGRTMQGWRYQINHTALNPALPGPYSLALYNTKTAAASAARLAIAALREAGGGP